MSDPLDRLSLVTRPDGEGTQYSYNHAPYSSNSANLAITTKTDQTGAGDGNIASQTYFDGFARQIQMREFEDGNTQGTNYISTEQTFDALGRAYTTSLPHRPGPLGGDRRSASVMLLCRSQNCSPRAEPIWRHPFKSGGVQPRATATRTRDDAASCAPCAI